MTDLLQRSLFDDDPFARINAEDLFIKYFSIGNSFRLGERSLTTRRGILPKKKVEERSTRGWGSQKCMLIGCFSYRKPFSMKFWLPHPRVDLSSTFFFGRIPPQAADRGT